MEAITLPPVAESIQESWDTFRPVFLVNEQAIRTSVVAHILVSRKEGVVRTSFRYKFNKWNMHYCLLLRDRLVQWLEGYKTEDFAIVMKDGVHFLEGIISWPGNTKDFAATLPPVTERAAGEVDKKEKEGEKEQDRVADSILKTLA